MARVSSFFFTIEHHNGSGKRLSKHSGNFYPCRKKQAENTFFFLVTNHPRLSEDIINGLTPNICRVDCRRYREHEPQVVDFSQFKGRDFSMK